MKILYLIGLHCFQQHNVLLKSYGSYEQIQMIYFLVQCRRHQQQTPPDFPQASQATIGHFLQMVSTSWTRWFSVKHFVMKMLLLPWQHHIMMFQQLAFFNSMLCVVIHCTCGCVLFWMVKRVCDSVVFEIVKWVCGCVVCWMMKSIFQSASVQGEKEFVCSRMTICIWKSFCDGWRGSLDCGHTFHTMFCFDCL